MPGTALTSLEEPATCHSVGGFTCKVRVGDSPIAFIVLGHYVRDADPASAFDFNNDFG